MNGEDIPKAVVSTFTTDSGASENPDVVIEWQSLPYGNPTCCWSNIVITYCRFMERS